MRFWFAALLLIATLAGCAESIDPFYLETPAYSLDPHPGDFVTAIDHPYLPFVPGATWTYIVGGDSVADLEAGRYEERIEVEVLSETRNIMGVQATVVRDVVYYADGTRNEVTDDWYAQDADGNVWYLGEDTCEYESDVCVSHAGAWEWGVDGALPGIIMWADPQPSGPYYQEYYIGEALDRAQVVARGRAVETPLGAFTDTVTIEEWAPIAEHVEVELVHYVRGIGLVMKGEKDGLRIDDPETLVAYEIPGFGAGQAA